MLPLDPIPLADIQAARARLVDVPRTPLVRLNVDDAPAEILLKLENLQPIGSFKLRGAGNAMLLAGRDRLADGVWTASAGNMAQGVAWHAWRMGVSCRVVVPDHAPETKLAAIRRLGAEIIKIPFSEWAQILRAHRYDDMRGLFIHPVSDPAVIAGNGTIGLEIFEDAPDVDTVLIPYGGGGLSCGIASALRALKPGLGIFACEVETAAPLAASLAAGTPTDVPYTPSFVDGIGAPFVLPEMWPLASSLLDGSLVMTLAEIAAAIRTLAERNRLIAEGAGAAPVAAALTSRAVLSKRAALASRAALTHRAARAGRAGGGKVVCVVSGGNIDAATLTRILAGEIP